MTPADLIAAVGCSPALAETFAEPLAAAMERYGIDTPARQAAFLAQVSHESGKLKWVRELWGPTPAQMRYSGRVDLGNTRPEAMAFAQAAGMEVGRFYAGHGLIQVTGYTNHVRMAARLGIDCARNPRLLEEPAHAAMSAADFWDDHGLNDLADGGEFETITRRVNGGMNGYTDRVIAWDLAKDALGVA